MALEKVLALDSTGVIEKEIDTGGGGASLPAWGMLGATVPAAGGTGTDLDTMVTQGYFVVFSPVNAPLDIVSSIHVFVLADTGGSGRSVQIAQFASQHIWYIRNQSSGVWSGWDRLLLSTDAQTSQSDTTVSALLRVGAFGLGGNSLPIPSANCDLIEVGGLYSIETTTNAPVGASSGSQLLHMSYSSGVSGTEAQLVICRSSFAQRMWIRSRATGTWQPWAEVWTSDNLIKQSSQTDTTADVMLLIGAFGLGKPVNLASQDLDDNSLVTGMYYCLSPTNGPGGNGHLWQHYRSTTVISQIYITASTNPVIWIRGKNATWGAWTQLANQTDLDALTAAVAAMDDGVTIDNICDLAMDGQELINTMNPHFYKKNVGAARLVDQLRLPANNYALSMGVSDNENAISGTGASVIGGLAGPQLSTGTTATGYANARRFFDTTVSTPAYDIYNKQVANDAVGHKMAVRCGIHLSAASDATNTYTARITLLGSGPGTNTAPTVSTTGIVLTYTHSVNSGNFVITYRGGDGTLKTINTTVAPGFGAVGTTKHIIAKTHRSAAGVSTTTVSINGTDYTFTNSAFNTNTAYNKCAIAFQLVKTVGTTAVTMGVRATALACNFP